MFLPCSQCAAWYSANSTLQFFKTRVDQSGIIQESERLQAALGILYQ